MLALFKYNNRLKNIFNNHLYTLSLYVRRIASAVVVFFLARFLTLHDYGLYSSYSNIASLCLLVTNMGFNEYILVSTKNKLQKIKLEVTFFLIFALIVISIILFFCPFIPLENTSIFSLVLLKVFFDNTFFALILPYFQSAKQFNTIAKINIFYGISIILIALISYYIKLQLQIFLILIVSLGIINFIQCSYFSKLKYTQIFTKYKIFLKLIDKSILYYISVATIVFIKGQLSSLYVSFVLPKEQTAIYFASWNIATILSLVSIAQIQQLCPELINKKYTQIQAIMHKNLKFIIFINLLILAFFTLFGKYVLLIIYGSWEYTRACPYLLVLTTCTLLSSIGMVFATYMTSQGYQKYKSKLQIEFLIFVSIVMLIFSRLGIWGAILTSLALEIYTCTRYFCFYIKNMKQLKIKDC